MRIGIDARALSVGRGGIFVGMQNLLSELLAMDREGEYYLYSHRDFQASFGGAPWRKRIGSLPRAVPGTIWLQMLGRRMIIADHVDVFWGCNHILPRNLPPRMKKLITVHDLTWRLFPETMKTHNRLFHRLFFERSIRAADVIMADSESTARDLERLFGVSRSKLKVVYYAASDRITRHDPLASAAYVAAKFGVSRNYVCAVGTIEPRKNLATLVEAMGRLHARGAVTHQLLIVGAAGWKDSRIYSSVRQFGLTPNEVAFLGHVADDDLPRIYSGAAAFAFPSLYEGFGLPLVEAMACGAPIIASNASSIPEIVGDAGILVSPQCAEDFAEAISRVVSDTLLRHDLVEKGLRRARHFRWDTAAQEILRLFSESVRTAGVGPECVSETAAKRRIH